MRFLESKGYFVLADTWLNTIFVLESAWKAAMPERLSDTRRTPADGRQGRMQAERDLRHSKTRP
jgi:hypothetical protein